MVFMKDNELKFDRKCHVLYSKACKKEIKSKIAIHYKFDEQEKIWEQIQNKYVEFLSDWRTDLGGKKNFHNGTGGTYDCIAIMAYYVICKEKTNLAEIEEMEGNLFLPAFRKMAKFVDCNKPFFKKLMYFSFCNAKKQCDKWNDYQMNVAPFNKSEPIYYEFTKCPVAEFAKKHNLEEIMPSFCNPDYTSMELIHARLIRKTTCSNSNKCDYTLYGDRDKRINEHTEYTDEKGYKRNK